MSQPQDGTAAQRALIRELVGEIEVLRLRRKDAWHDRLHPEGKRFTQEELTLQAYGSYKNMVLERTLRIPSRAGILAIADYLECTIHETNDLLLAAHYIPELIELREDEEHAALVRAQAMIHSLPLPACVVVRGWYAVDANEYMSRGNNLPTPSHIAARRETPFHYFGDPAHPAYATYAFNETMWQHSVRNLFQQFQHVHERYRRETWYRNLLDEVRLLPRFASSWERLMLSPTDQVSPGATYTWSPLLQTYYRDAASILHVAPTTFPQIVIYYPLDAAALAAYRALGCPIDENGWDQVVQRLA